MLSEMRAYQPFESNDVRVLVKRIEDGLASQLLVMQTPFGYRRVAEMYSPEGDGLHAAILYVHWYEPESISSHRSQFEEEAQELARVRQRNVVSTPLPRIMQPHHPRRIRRRRLKLELRHYAFRQHPLALA